MIFPLALLATVVNPLPTIWCESLTPLSSIKFKYTLFVPPVAVSLAVFDAPVIKWATWCVSPSSPHVGTPLVIFKTCPPVPAANLVGVPLADQ